MAYKAFVSSTFEDLKEHRKAVIASLRKAGLFVDPMEDWTAATDKPKKFSQDRVKDCDLCVLLVGFRRGHVAEGEELSITQLEYQAAVRLGIDVLVFMLKEDAPWQRKFDELDKDPGIRQFRTQLQECKGVGFFGLDPNSIEIASAITRWIAEKQKSLGSASSPLASPPPDWPQQVLESLATKLSDEFDFHMRAGEDLSPDQARVRYIQGVLKLRERPDNVLVPLGSHKFSRGMEGPLEDFLASDGVQLLVIGAGGSGKTTMLKHVAADGARRAVQDPRAPIAVYLRLASFDRADGGLDLLLDRLSMAAQLERQEFEVQWREGHRPAIFLLDGLNEVAQAYQPSCTQALWTLLQNSPPLHRYVITSRPGGELEGMSSRSIENQRLRLVDILEFKREQIQEYIKAQGRTELWSRISGQLENLASNPFLLWAITRTLVGSQGRDAKNRGSLFQSLIDGYIFEERERSKPIPRPTNYNYELVKKPILAKLALKMIEDGVTVVRDAPELWQQVSKYLVDLEREHYRVLALEAETFMPADYAATTLLREILSNGVLLHDGSLRFMHESVQEYFAAVALDTATVDDLVRRAPDLNLAALDARGPMFETLVTWAGLSTPKNVAALVEHLQGKHSLLAAHLAAEAGLPDAELRQLRHQFLAFTTSQHEQHRCLGVMGLAVVPSDEPSVVAQLVAMLGDRELNAIADTAEKALKAMPTPIVLAALVKTWIASSKEVNSKEIRLLRDLAIEQARAIVEVLLDAWTAQDSRRDRVAKVAAVLDSRESWDKHRRPAIREAMLTLAVEAELTGNLRRSADIAALRQRAEETSVPSLGIKGMGALIRKNLESLSAWDRECEKLAAAYADKDDAALALLVRDGQPAQCAAALDILVERGASEAVAPVAQAALNNPQTKWLNALESLPREAVQQHLANEIETLEGERLERARLLAGLLVDEPQRVVLERVFRDSGEELRAFAVRAAARAGAEGLELIIKQLGNEASRTVLAACVSALGSSHNPAAVRHLLDLLFDPAARQHWTHGEYTELVSDPESGSSRGSDGWAALIHSALADAGAADRTLERLEHEMRTGHPVDGHYAIEAIHEARRWLPEPRAIELLNRAMVETDAAVRLCAQWSLACVGNAVAWQMLLQSELENPSDFVGYAQDAARRLGATAIEPATRDPLIAASQAVLRTALADADEKRRARALELTRRLPEQWVETAWRSEALATAELLFQSTETDQRVQAVRALHRFADDGDDRIFTILMNDSDKAVIECAHRILGDVAAARLEERLQAALQLGDATATQHIASLVGTLLKYSGKLGAIRDSVGTWLDTGNRDQCVAALLALVWLYPEYNSGEEWEELSKRARAAFQRHGVEELWRPFAVYAKSLSESGREFIYLVFDAFSDETEQLACLVSWATELWPDDLQILADSIVVALWRDDREQAAEQIAVIQERFDDRINHVWLGDRLYQLDRPHDALRHYRIAVEREPTNHEAHFKVGWFAFLSGDLEGSIQATRRSLELEPTSAVAEFNLGLALLARKDTAAAEAAYRRGVALARQQALADARQVLEAALGDFALLPELPPATNSTVDRIRTWLQKERDRLGAG